MTSANFNRRACEFSGAWRCVAGVRFQGRGGFILQVEERQHQESGQALSTDISDLQVNSWKWTVLVPRLWKEWLLCV